MWAPIVILSHLFYPRRLLPSPRSVPLRMACRPPPLPLRRPRSCFDASTPVPPPAPTASAPAGHFALPPAPSLKIRAVGPALSLPRPAARWPRLVSSPPSGATTRLVSSPPGDRRARAPHLLLPARRRSDPPQLHHTRLSSSPPDGAAGGGGLWRRGGNRLTRGSEREPSHPVPRRPSESEVRRRPPN